MSQLAANAPNATTNGAPLHFLVDYDNLRRFSAGKSLDAVVTHLVGAVPRTILEQYSTLNFRLYGGWRSGNTSTKAAQNISSPLSSLFPLIHQFKNSADDTVQVRVLASLVHAGLFLPATSVGETFIRGRSSRRLYTEPRNWFSCAAEIRKTVPLCPLQSIEKFLKDDLCPDSTCSVTSIDILRQDEQKQVDTLLVADLAHLSLTESAQHVVVVSSDADIWPGILLGLSKGTYVIQIHTSSGTKTPQTQSIGLGVLRSKYLSTSV